MLETVRKIPPVAALGPALVLLIGLMSGESAAQYPPQPVAPPEPGLRGLGREFFTELFYPVRAIPQSFQPTPRRVAMRPSYGGGTQAVVVPPAPVRPLYLSGYAGAQAPPRRLLTPTHHHRPVAPYPGHGPTVVPPPYGANP